MTARVPPTVRFRCSFPISASRIDTKALRAKHPQAARECTITDTVPMVRVKAVEDVG